MPRATPRRPPTAITHADRGAVTVEAALALCGLMTVLAMVIGAVMAISAQLRCQDAAREAARLVARGEPERAREVAGRLAPEGSHVDVRISGDEVAVEVSAGTFGKALPGLRVAGRAVGLMEPDVAASAPP